jgi:hypothetical protein
MQQEIHRPAHDPRPDDIERVRAEDLWRNVEGNCGSKRGRDERRKAFYFLLEGQTHLAAFIKSNLQHLLFSAGKFSSDRSGMIS